MMLEWVNRVLEKDTMSLHLRSGAPPVAKRGRPGNWQLVQIDDTPLHEEELLQLADDLIRLADEERDSFIEQDTETAQVLQVRNMRIVIAYPPFSDALEITIVKPITTKTLDDYELPEKILDRLQNKAEGVVIAGAPGAGKSTFAAAIAKFYADQDRVVKTIEKPRDLVVDERITQYTIVDNDPEHTGDIILLLRPDYVIFDEMRKTRDFVVFADMRLAGIGMVGVVHATRPVDAIQRFIGRVDAGLIPSVVDTIIFIEDGAISTVLALHMVVKVPTGFADESLARPVVEVKDFMTGRLLFEIYSFGEQIVMIPVQATEEKQTKEQKQIAKRVKREIARIISGPIEAVPLRPGRIEVKVPESQIPRLIGKGGKVISKLENKLNISIDVSPINGNNQLGFEKEYVDIAGRQPATIERRKKHVVIILPSHLAGKTVSIYVGDKHYGVFTVNEVGEIRLSKSSKIAKHVVQASEYSIPITYQEIS